RELDQHGAREAARRHRERFRHPVLERGDGHDAQPGRHPRRAGEQGSAGGVSATSRPPAPQLPLVASGTGRPRCVARRRCTLDAATWDSLRERAAEAGVTPLSTLACAFADILAAWAREPRFTFAVAYGDTLLPLEVDADPDLSFRERATNLQLRLQA